MRSRAMERGSKVRFDSTPPQRPMQSRCAARTPYPPPPVHQGATNKRPPAPSSCFWSLFCFTARIPACAVLLLTAFGICRTSFAHSPRALGGTAHRRRQILHGLYPHTEPGSFPDRACSMCLNFTHDYDSIAALFFKIGYGPYPKPEVTVGTGEGRHRAKPPTRAYLETLFQLL